MGGARSDGTEPCEMLGQLLETARVTALAELAAGIAHEINQPLGAIATFAQAAERMLAKPAPMIGQSIDVMRQIHQQALDASTNMRRIRALFDPQKLPRSACRMPEVIADLRPVLDFMASRVRGRLTVDLPEDTAALSIDRPGIQHVLFTMVQNACEASSAVADPVIELSVRGDRYSVETGVADRGTGVPPELRERLFQPYFTTKPRGTGFGLASCRAIVEAHGGGMGFDDRPGGGSRFWFRLPIVIAPHADDSDTPRGGGASLEG